MLFFFQAEDGIRDYDVTGVQTCALPIYVNAGACTGTEWLNTSGDLLESYSPGTGELIGKIQQGSWNDYETVIATAQTAFVDWRVLPAPKRGEIVRQIGNELRKHKEPLGRLVAHEMGKIYQEGLGEVQEMIDICDFAVGLSRQLHGYTMHSERPGHRMYDQYHPLGIVGVISAFNFPVAVWAWNAMLAMVCGDVVVWKPSSKVMLCAIAVSNIVNKVLKRNQVPEGVLNLVASSSKYVGDDFLADKRVALISATGSTKVGKKVARIVGERLGKTILELGGNNAIIISDKADMNLVMPAVVFGSVGTAGQRCTSTRRLIVHETMYDTLIEKLKTTYSQLKIGNPLDEDTHVGPLIDKWAVEDFQSSIQKVKDEGGNVIIGGDVLEGEGYESGCYVTPCIAEAEDRKSTRLNSSHVVISYAVFCLKKKKINNKIINRL